MFGEEMGTIEEEKYMLKIHHFDLANLIKDSELIGTSTMENMDRVFRRLEIRDKWHAEGPKKYTVSRIGKIWKAEFKYLISNLERSITELDDIIKKLDILKKACEKTKGTIQHKSLIIK